MAPETGPNRLASAVNALFPRAVVRGFWLPLGIALVVGELVTRAVGASECAPVVPKATGWDTMIADPHYLWKLEPNRLFESPNGNTQANAVGLRAKLLPTDAKSTDERRIILTGDSAVYGWGLPDGKTYGEQLEAELNAGMVGAKVSVINLGIPGYSTEQTLMLLDEVGWSYAPDLLLVHNIFSDCNIDAFQDREALRLANPENSAVYRTLHHSRLYCAAYMPLAHVRASFMQEPDRLLMPGRPAGPNAAMALEKIDQVLDMSRVPLPDYLENLGRMRDGATAHHAAMVLGPLAQEWDAGVWTLPGTPAPTAGQVLPWHPYRTAQQRWAPAHDVDIIDIPAAYAAAPGDHEDLFIDNVHPTEWGARVLTCAVATYLRKHPSLLGLSAAQLPMQACTLTPPTGGAKRVRPPQGAPPGPPPGGPPGPPPGGPPGGPPPTRI